MKQLKKIKKDLENALKAIDGLIEEFDNGIVKEDRLESKYKIEIEKEDKE